MPNIKTDMRELSLNILDIVQNSISAGATLITIQVKEDTVSDTLTIGISDNGCGMTEQQVAQVRDPFYTTRTTRKVGMGVPLMEMAAALSGGSLDIRSQVGVGTDIRATFGLSHIDRMPMGDLCATYTTLIRMNPQIDFTCEYQVDDKSFTVDTRQLKDILGDVPLDEPDVMEWITRYFQEQMQLIDVKA